MATFEFQSTCAYSSPAFVTLLDVPSMTRPSSDLFESSSAQSRDERTKASQFRCITCS